MKVVASPAYMAEQPEARWAPSALVTRAVVNGLAALGVDDLAKYRIVETFHSNPASTMGPADCAGDLGLRSVELTASILEQLSAAGVLAPVERRPDGTSEYGLTRDRDVRERLRWYYTLAHGSPGGGGVLRALARRSLEKASALGRQTRRGRGAVDANHHPVRLSSTPEPVGRTVST